MARGKRTKASWKRTNEHSFLCRLRYIGYNKRYTRGNETRIFFRYLLSVIVPGCAEKSSLILADENGRGKRNGTDTLTLPLHVYKYSKLYYSRLRVHDKTYHGIRNCCGDGGNGLHLFKSNTLSRYPIYDEKGNFFRISIFRFRFYYPKYTVFSFRIRASVSSGFCNSRNTTPPPYTDTYTLYYSLYTSTILRRPTMPDYLATKTATTFNVFPNLGLRFCLSFLQIRRGCFSFFFSLALPSVSRRS